MESVKISKSKLPPCTISRIDNQLVVGTYHLDKPSGMRTGSLDLYDLDLNLVKSTDTESAILDTKVDGRKIYTADSSGSVNIWNTDFKILDTLKLKEDALITQIELRDQLLAATTTTGDLVVYDIEARKALFTEKIHSLEAWTVAWNDSHNVFTGGDDHQLSFTDLRIPYTLWKIKPHEAGVTSILPSCYRNGEGGGNENELWTGGYDDCLNLLDLRTKRVTKSQQLSGGVWRLIPNEANSRILACCMYGGLQILNGKDLCQIENELSNHESMVYGGVWLDNDTGITCSFYDLMLQKWRI